MAFTTARGSRLYYEVHGDEDKEPLLYLGGWGLSTGDFFSRIGSALRDEFRIVVYDHRGLGRSDDDPEPGATDRYAVDAAAVLAAAGIDRAHVLGHGGLGAGIAQCLAIQNPESVHDMVLTSAWAGPEPFHDAQVETLLVARRDSGFQAFRNLAVVYGYLPEYINANPDVFFRGWDGPGNVSERTDAHISLIQANIRHDARADLGSLACPTLLVCGAEEHLGSPRLSRELQSLIPGSELLILDGAPHVFRSVPSAEEQYLRACVDFFTQHPIRSENLTGAERGAAQ